MLIVYNDFSHSELRLTICLSVHDNSSPAGCVGAIVDYMGGWAVSKEGFGRSKRSCHSKEGRKAKQLHLGLIDQKIVIKRRRMPFVMI
mmetsp:Transcript_40432/g.94994  ORF Transcript_40432/g.94994 Transcript_40432/m.94994 type:complete len:88 (-) Transcript_40432:168-431(-)